MEAYSHDLRDRTVAALEARQRSREQIAQTFGVSRSFVQKLWRRWQETGSSAADAHHSAALDRRSRCELLS